MTEESNGSVIVVPPPRPRRWVTLVLCTVILIAGGVLGSGITILLDQEDWPRPKRTFEERRDRLVNRIAEKLQLDPAQTESLREIVGRRLKNLEAIREKILPEMEAESNNLYRELSARLNKQQQKQWDELHATLHERWFSSTEKGEEEQQSPSEGASSQPAN
ncbi:MAG: hypothetical protein JXA11_02060 [Phycisphaerae bacterium]|nr:hypothetical protein [Phycisphaerae bacterium]